MKRSRPLRFGVPPADADAVVKVVFESARRSGVDVPRTTTSSSSTQGPSSGSSSASSEAARRQAREYAMRVQQFREQQKKAQSFTPAATLQFTISSSAEGEEDPLANLFSDIEAPRLKQLTRPIPAPAKPVPSLWGTPTHAAKQASSSSADGGAAQQQQQEKPVVMARSKKRPPSPTRKSSPLKIVPVAKPKPALKLQVPVSAPQRKASPQKVGRLREGEKSSMVTATFSSSQELSHQQQQQQKLTMHVLEQEGDQQHPAIKMPTKIATSLSAPAAAAATATPASFDEHHKIPTSSSSAAATAEQQQESPAAATSPLFAAVSRPSVAGAEATSAAETEAAAAAASAAAATVVSMPERLVVTGEARRAETADDSMATIADRSRDAATVSSIAAAVEEQQQQAASTITTTATATTPSTEESVEQWSTLRATELEDIKSEREAAAAAAVAEEAAKVEKQKIDAWIKSRIPEKPQDPLTHFAGKLPSIGQMHELHRAATWERAFTAFNNVHREPSTSQETLSHALALAVTHTLRWPLQRRMELVPKFEALTGRMRALPQSTKNLIKLCLETDDEMATELFSSLSDADKALLPRFMFERYSFKNFHNQFEAGSWSTALEFVANMKKIRADPFLRLESLLLRVISQKGHIGGAQRRPQMLTVVQGLEQQCRSKLSQIGRSHAVELMYAFNKVRSPFDVRRIYAEMKERGELDEEIAGAFLRVSNTAQIEATIPELREHNVNVLSSACTRAIVYSMTSREEHGAAMETMRAFATVTPPSEWSVFDCRAAAVACEANSNEAADPGIVDAVRAAAMAAYQRNAEQGVKQVGVAACPKVASFLILSLLSLGRTHDVLEVGRTLCEPGSTTVDRLTEAAFEALNSTLSVAGLPQREVSTARAKLVDVWVQQAQQREAAAAGTDAAATTDGTAPAGAAGTSASAAKKPEPASAVGDKAPSMSSTSGQQQHHATIPSHVSDKMLELLRTKNWSEALSTLQSLDLKKPVVPELANSVTMLYNCAISAAVDHVDVVEKLVDDMQNEAKLSANATTNNTIMTAFGKTEGRWQEALSLFENKLAAKDASSYSVALSVLGKRSLWESAAQVFSDMKKQPGISKPSPVAYGLLIQAAHRDNWELTLQAFQEMVKTHGAGSVREVVSNRVVKALDGANRTAEATRLLESLRQKSKKKK